MPVSDQQLAQWASTHKWRIPFDTSPRHLAGPGDARHVTHGLAAAGWKRTSDPLSLRLVLTSPDHRYRLDFSPESGIFAWWQLWAEATDTERSWAAGFGELVPAEVLGAFTDALITTPPQRHSTPLDVLDAAGWLIDARGAASSPDATCLIEQHADRPDDPRTAWHVEVSDPDRPRSRIWHAHFDAGTPDHLVTAFVTALSDSAPLQRGMYDRTAHHTVTQQRSTLTPQQIIEAHTTRLNALRAQARAARRHSTTAAAVPAPPAATPPAARR
ncbi:DUF317 domain-containing protein [Streptomyces achromogenes]|uniref:DUF317 domain-containing protein n=1 Tax=Streptomyces achromogenes TaxID=67255 RepID=UPI0036739AB3